MSCRTALTCFSRPSHHHESGMSAKQFEHVFVARAALWEGPEVIRSVLLPAPASQRPSIRQTGQNLQTTLADSQTLHGQCKTAPEYSFYESTRYIIYVWLRTCSQFTASCFSSGVSVEDTKTDTKGSFSCRSAAECRRVCNPERSPQLSCLLNPAQNVFKDQQ